MNTIDKAIHFLDANDLLDSLDVVIVENDEDEETCFMPRKNKIIVSVAFDERHEHIAAEPFHKLFENERKFLDVSTIAFCHELGHYFHKKNDPIHFETMLIAQIDALKKIHEYGRQVHREVGISLTEVSRLANIHYRSLPLEQIADRNAKMICSFLIDNIQLWNMEE